MKVFPPQQIFSRRHLPTWLILAGSAGSVNAAALFACQRYVTHVTGTVTRLGVDWGTRLALEYGLVLVSFIVGAMSSVLVLEARFYRGKKPLPGLALLVVTAVLVLVAGLGRANFFGEFGVGVETAGDFALLSMLAFAMGLQNASVASITGNMVRTTHLTGPATDVGVGLSLALLIVGEKRRELLSLAGLRIGKIISFSLGAALMVPLSARFGYLVFLFPAATITLANVLSFEPWTVFASTPTPTAPESKRPLEASST